MIWIIGGTKDSRTLIEKLVKFTKDIVVSITTSYGEKLVLDYEIKVLSRHLNEEEKIAFISSNKINLIVDMSHPYAQNVSKTMMALAKKCDIEYLRFERAFLDYKEAKSFEDINSLVKYLNKNCKEGNILSTLGSKNLKDLKELKEQEKLFVRILPVLDSIKKAEELGFLAKKIIAMQGPFPQDFNEAIFKNYEIKYLLTKQSGQEGGELEKVKAAKKLGVEIVVLKRPAISYPKVVSNLDEVITFIKSKIYKES